LQPNYSLNNVMAAFLTAVLGLLVSPTARFLASPFMDGAFI